MDKIDLSPFPDDVREAVTLRKLASGAAVNKYQTILNHAERDWRCRHAHVYYRAGTGRFQGGGVNFLNLARLTSDERTMFDCRVADRLSAITYEADLMNACKWFQDQDAGVIDYLGGMIRLAVCAPPGKKLIVRDYSSIEMNMLHWLADDDVVCQRIADFYAGKGQEPYKIAACGMYKKDIHKVDWRSSEGKRMRSAGKVYYLGSGYGAGAKTLQNFAANYGINMTLEDAQEMVTHYRVNNPKVKHLWHSYLNSMVKAVDNPGREYDVKGVTFRKRGSTLRVRLRSGRELCYYNPSVVEGRYGKEIQCVDIRKFAGDSPRMRSVAMTTIVENIDQATSRDLLADALIRCEAENIPVILHVYDEIVAEVDENDDNAINVLAQIMTSPPAWAKGLPIQVKGGASRRYIK